MNNMYIICRESGIKGMLNFYAETQRERYFLFHQKFKHSTYAFYKNGVSIHKVFDFKTAHGNRDIENVLVKSGINDGDIVILSNIHDGEKVKIEK